MLFSSQLSHLGGIIVGILLHKVSIFLNSLRSEKIAAPLNQPILGAAPR
jgi:hypothetical protein